MDENDLEQIRKLAGARGLTVAEWVRQSLRDAAKKQPSGDVDRKLESVRAASRHSFPTSDIDDMLDEIERGYLDG